MLSSCHLAGLCCCSLVSQLKLTFKYMYICCNMKRLNLRSQCYFCVLCRCFNKQQLFPHDRRFSSSWSAAYETGGLGRGFEGSRLGKEIPCRSYTKGQSRRATIQGSQSDLRCVARERFGPTTVSSVRNIFGGTSTRVVDSSLPTV